MKQKTTVIAFAAQKGGCGKTTVCIPTASFFHYTMGKKVLVIDTDGPQYSFWTLRNDDLKNLENNEAATQQFIKQNIAIYPVLQLSLEDLPDKLTELRTSGEYDVIIVDTPGTVNVKGYKEGLKACDYVFCPFEAETMSLNSNMEYIVFLIKSIIGEKDSHIKGYGVFWNKVKKTASRDLFVAIDTELRNSGINVLPVIVEDSVNYQRDITRSTLFPIAASMNKSQLASLIHLINDTVFKN
jgi:chromosome partitioning protein